VIARVERNPANLHDRVAAAYQGATGPAVRHLDGTASRPDVLAAAWAALVEARPDTFRHRR
jgi:hypothetical protein